MERKHIFFPNNVYISRSTSYIVISEELRKARQNQGQRFALKP